MSETREFYAATVEEAVEKAAEALGLTARELSYEVVDSGTAGFLGIGARDARIVVQLTEPEPVDNPPVPEEAGEEDRSETGGTADTSTSIDRFPDEEPDDAPVVDDNAVIDPAPEVVEPVPDELLKEVDALVTSIIGEMGFEARVDVYDAGEVVAVDVASQETGLFIGQKGETIDALQYLVNVAIYKNRPFSKRIVLDSEGYRQRRVEALHGMAHRIARRAVRERRSVELPPMSSAERRIVHVYLKDNPKVVTFSEGSGSNRRVKVSPA